MRDRVVEVLRGIYDPELPINIYDLGLVRRIDVEGDRVRIDMVFTAGRMCPMPDMISVQIRHRIKRELGLDAEVHVDLDAGWSPSMATPEGRRQLEEIFGKDAVESAMRRGKMVVRISREQREEEFNPVEYMRRRVEERYRNFKEWYERTRIV